MERCVSCQYYDRKHAKGTADSAPSCGQCRRAAPMLNPANSKSYMIEGVWPTVRDDDWCGEWKLVVRRADSGAAEERNAPRMPGPQSMSTPAVRTGQLASVAPTGDVCANAAAAARATIVAPAVMGCSASD